MAIRGFSLMLGAACVLAALASIAVPVDAGQPDRAVMRRIEVPAHELSDALRPVETPPPDFAAGQYIDSAGCVFVQTDRGWRGRVARDGTPICGYPPTLSARRTGPDSVTALFPEPEAPATRLTRELTAAIIPHLQPGELADVEPAGHAALDMPPPRAAGDQDPLHIGAMTRGAPELSRQIAGAGRTDRLCALIGASRPETGAGLGLCGAKPIELALSSQPGTAPGTTVPFDESAGKTGSAHVPKAGKAAKEDTPRKKIAATASTRPEKPVSPAQGKRLDDARLIPPGARFVQVGAFRNVRQAHRTAQGLAGMGLPVVRGKGKGDSQLIMVGPLDGREAIVRMIEKLRRAGYHDVHARR